MFWKSLLPIGMISSLRLLSNLFVVSKLGNQYEGLSSATWGYLHSSCFSSSTKLVDNCFQFTLNKFFSLASSCVLEGFHLGKFSFWCALLVNIISVCTSWPVLSLNNPFPSLCKNFSALSCIFFWCSSLLLCLQKSALFGCLCSQASCLSVSILSSQLTILMWDV